MLSKSLYGFMIAKIKKINAEMDSRIEGMAIKVDFAFVSISLLIKILSSIIFLLSKIKSAPTEVSAPKNANFNCVFIYVTNCNIIIVTVCYNKVKGFWQKFGDFVVWKKNSV